MTNKQLIDKLNAFHELSKEEWIALIKNQDAQSQAYAAKLACELRESLYGKRVFLRGLIEFTNYCKNDCYYCGIRRSNKHVARYRLDKETILSCCREGRALDFRTFVLQGGEDPYFTDERLVDLVESIKREHPDCRVTLSVGERSFESYKRLKEAGADRYLLRHETANEAHYAKLHPASLLLENRKRCLWDLKELGFQVGSGFMVGSPYQTVETLADDFLFLAELKPHMVGIGPFIPHHDTQFANEVAGSVNQTLFLLSLIRIMLPSVLLPATTALGTLDPFGREKGMQAGANVLMPNLSPVQVRGDYLLYDNKICTGDESAYGVDNLAERMRAIGYELAFDDPGDAFGF